MRCSSRATAVLRALLWFALLACSAGARAHKSSDAYLQIDPQPGRLVVRWDIALRDLDVAIDLDADGDGRLTWGEIKAALPRIEAYALPRLAIDGCHLTVEGTALERRNDGAYVALHLIGRCRSAEAGPIRYTLFSDVDPTHRGIARIGALGGAVQLLMLDPGAGPQRAPGLSQTAQDRGTAPTGSRWQFLAEGVRHILTGYDHILFLICLLLPSVMQHGPSGWRPVSKLSRAILPIIGIVSAFTVAHSITLGLAALKIVSIPSWFIEPAIAVTIMLAALDNVMPIFPVKRVVVTFFFGLIHGFGFASVLSELNLSTADFAWALLQFNLGLEAGQLMIVTIAVSILFALRSWERYRPIVVRGGSLAAFAVAALWCIERTANVSLLPL